MIAKKINKFSIKKIAILSAVTFFVGNRLTVLYLLDIEENFFQKILNAMDNFFPSFSFSKLGISVSLLNKAVLMGILFAILGLLFYCYYFTKRKNFRFQEEHGSSRYGVLTEAKVLEDKVEDNNLLFSKNIKLSQNTRQTFLNTNVMVIGGSGSGKTRYIVKPNALQFNSNYCFTDPKGKLVEELGNAFLEKNYSIKILNLVDMENTMNYNPFHYCKNANDIMKLIDNIMTNTSDPTRKGGDEFWDKAAQALLLAFSFLIMGVGEKDDQCIPRILDLLSFASASENDENQKSIIDIVFEDLEEELNCEFKDLQFTNEYDENYDAQLKAKNSYSFLACRFYNLYKKASGTTAKSILITLAARLAIFELPAVNKMLRKDELDLFSIANPKVLKNNEYEKSALFICTSDKDKTFNFLAAIVYQQLFDILYHYADQNPNGRLPVHTRFYLDEFKNIGKIPDFEIKLATMRSREISAWVILQTLSQLKEMYPNDAWESLYGNCDTTIFLGGKEFTTLEYLSKNIGTTTIDYHSNNITRGMNGSFSQNEQIIQRSLLNPDEIKRLKSNECLIDIRGHFIYYDEKFNLENHKNYKLTSDFSKDNFFDTKNYIVEKRKNKNFAYPLNPKNQKDFSQYEEVVIHI